jgi:hypothetical protein
MSNGLARAGDRRNKILNTRIRSARDPHATKLVDARRARVACSSSVDCTPTDRRRVHGCRKGRRRHKRHHQPVSVEVNTMESVRPRESLPSVVGFLSTVDLVGLGFAISRTSKCARHVSRGPIEKIGPRLVRRYAGSAQSSDEIGANSSRLCQGMALPGSGDRDCLFQRLRELGSVDML